jgi:hypothetical protein
LDRLIARLLVVGSFVRRLTAAAIEQLLSDDDQLLASLREQV